MAPNRFPALLILTLALATTIAAAASEELPATTPHGILADRVAPLAHLEDLDGVEPVIGDLPRWRQAVHELRRGAERDLGWPSGRALQAERLAAAAGNEVPLAVLHARYDRLDGPGGTRPGTAFAAAPLRDRVYHGDRVVFTLDPGSILAHRTPAIRSLTFDPDDGTGPRPLAVGGTLEVRYGTTGIRHPVLTAALADGRTLTATMKLDVVALATPSPHDTLSITATVPYDGAVATGRAYVYLAAGHATLENPAIVVEGFDLDDTMDWPVLYDLLNRENLIEDLRTEGYDAVVLDFTVATEPIQRNAFVLTELLTQVAASLGPDGTVAVVGASMGGLVSRYALAWLEANGGHDVRTWISFDAPHTGANIPLGLQHWLRFFQGESEDAAFLLSRLDTPAARQMLLYHYGSTSGSTTAPDPLFANLRADLAAIGDWPTLPRRVAVANGSGTGADQGFAAGNQIILYEYRSLLADIDGNVWAVPDGGSATIFDGMINLLWPLPDSYETVTVGGTLPWDGAPGGSRASMAQMDTTAVPYGDIQALHDRHCFIPTVSALALEGAGPFFDVAGAPDLAALTPFDAVYWPAENQEHIAITAENKPWFMDEITAGVSDVPLVASGSGLILHPAAPNPFNPRTVIRFETAAPGRVELGIYDLAGRLVRTLAGGTRMKAGIHEASWDGRDRSGRSAAAGIYLVRLSADDQDRTARITLLK